MQKSVKEWQNKGAHGQRGSYLILKAETSNTLRIGFNNIFRLYAELLMIHFSVPKHYGFESAI